MQSSCYHVSRSVEYRSRSQGHSSADSGCFRRTTDVARFQYRFLAKQLGFFHNGRKRLLLITSVITTAKAQIGYVENSLSQEAFSISRTITLTLATKAGCQVLTQLPKVSRIIEAVMRISDLSAETWSFATHAAMSALMTYLWEDPQWCPRSSRPTGVRSGSRIFARLSCQDCLRWGGEIVFKHDDRSWTHIASETAWLESLARSMPKIQGIKISSPASDVTTYFATVI